MASSLSPATTAPTAPADLPAQAASPWPVFVTACVAVFLVSVDAAV